MDHLETIKTMTVRGLVGRGFALAALLAAAVAALGGWAIQRHGGEGGALSMWALGAAAAFAVGAVWLALDRLLAARERDHRSLPARPEFYDFDNHNQPMHSSEMDGARLRDLEYVVFDTETTGLKPAAGDEIISIAGVWVRNGEIDTGQPFTRLVNPGKPIPKESVRYHGITDEIVADERTIEEVLPAFKDFVGDAVLVAHNAAFDMAFLAKNREKSGVSFDNLVLDTLLLSVFAEAESRNHSLEAMAERLGVNIEGRHTALGDSIATAQVFVRLFDLLESRGVTTVRQAINVSLNMEQVRRLGKDW